MKGLKLAGSVGLGLALLAGGVSASWAEAWPSLGKSPTRDSLSSQPLGDSLSEEWKAALKATPLSSISSDGTRAYVGTDKGLVVAVELATGKPTWAFQAGDRVHSTPAVADGKVFFGSYDRHLYALEATSGKLLWKTASGGNEMSSPVVANGVVYMGSGFPNQKVLAVSLSGKILWQYDLGQMSYSSPALSGSTLIIAANNGFLTGLDAADGRFLWKKQTKGSVMMASPSASSLGTVLFAPGGEDPNVYAVSVEGKGLWTKPLVALAKAAPTRTVTIDSIPACDDPMENQRSGGDCEREKAKRAKSGAPARAPARAEGPTSILVSNLAISGDWAYALVTAGLQKLYALDLSDGSVRWSVDAGIPSTPAFISSPVVAGGRVYVGTGNGEVVVVNANSGATVQKLSLDGPINSAPAVASGRLLVATEAGSLYSLK
ncbi:MAG: PQQ-binding-like beta-propeller repeat protein [Nitrospirae bacterium]|nr:PQQ-binding-like beta-propeller repeat protein [Nitrospirota bacterium]